MEIKRNYKLTTNGGISFLIASSTGDYVKKIE